MTNPSFNFTGDWEFNLEFPEFTACFSETSNPYYYPSKNLRIEIQDDISENPDPNPEQLKTLQYILEHQKEIAERACKKVLEEIPQIIRDYNLEDERDYEDLTIDDIKERIQITKIHIQLNAKEGFAYYDLLGNCRWDEEHGLNLLFWKDNALCSCRARGEKTKERGTFWGQLNCLPKT
ncbi:MAG: hypothetical protein IPH89_16035 [Bacteroidetes bacterium]|nr:hypothetical protein [Bacteroidota bacterium]